MADCADLRRTEMNRNIATSIGSHGRWMVKNEMNPFEREERVVVVVVGYKCGPIVTFKF
jgi:hypothetical protein